MTLETHGSNKEKHPIINNEDFLKIMQPTANGVLRLSAYLTTHHNKNQVLTRPFLGRLHTEAAKTEEILDAYGAKNNKKWHMFRQRVAAIKLFSNLSYTLLHIRQAAPVYHLLPIAENFFEATQEAVATILETIFNAAEQLTNTATECGFPPDPPSFADDKFLEVTPKGKLKFDREKDAPEDPQKEIVHLATEFLNQSEECKLLKIYEKVQNNEYADCIPTPISEKEIRKIENEFHNLQSMYDTYISNSNIETINPELPLLRGHISLIFHLLEGGTELAHYYERHMAKHRNNPKADTLFPISPQDLLNLLVDYCIAFAHRYLQAAQKLCRAMIQEYAETGSIDVPVPCYRGFHVRPSTLVSKIVLHYGSPVYLEMDNTRYDASSPLELFRVNEKINAMKRKKIAAQVVNLPIVQQLGQVANLQNALKIVFFALIEEHKLILYGGHISFKDFQPIEGETLAEYTRRGIAYFLAMGKIDIQTDLKATFTGDKRVLEDIKLLADSGYGEDNFGNDIVLPEELAFLRR